MSASEQQRAEWLAPDFWEKLGRLEGRHQRIQSEQSSAQRGLERLAPYQAAELEEAWRRYCHVIAELDQTTAEFEALRSCPE
jgi:hypothetical protein